MIRYLNKDSTKNIYYKLMIEVVQGVGIVIIFFIIIYLTGDTNINRLNYVDSKKKRTIQLVSYNLKKNSLKYKEIDFINWDKDIICLQEYYNDITGLKKFNLHKSVNFNIVLSPNYKLLKDSGLVILSKFPIKFIDYIKFKTSCSYNCFNNQGFLIVKIRKLYIINTSLGENSSNINLKLEQINDYINSYLKDKNIIIMGSFGKNIFKIKGFSEFKRIYSHVPTMWENYGIYPTQSYFKIMDDMIPRWIDGALIKTNKHLIGKISVEDKDVNSPHLGISFELKKMK